MKQRQGCRGKSEGYGNFHFEIMSEREERRERKYYGNLHYSKNQALNHGGTYKQEWNRIISITGPLKSSGKL